METLQSSSIDTNIVLSNGSETLLQDPAARRARQVYDKIQQLFAFGNHSEVTQRAVERLSAAGITIQSLTQESFWSVWAALQQSRRGTLEEGINRSLQREKEWHRSQPRPHRS